MQDWYSCPSSICSYFHEIHYESCRCSPSTWILYALAVNQLGNKEDQVSGFDGKQQTIQEFMRGYFGYKYEFRWFAVLIIAAYLVAFRVAAMLALKFISFQRR